VRLPNGEIAPDYGNFVFASGWPGINDRDITELKYRFSVGRLLPENRMVGFRIRPPAEGYQAVYTSITYPGMSGGPVLDTDGRVIAVHGQNEGARVSNEASGVQRVLIGYSLAIPIHKFLNLAPQVNLSFNNLTVQTNHPQTVDEDYQDAIGAELVVAGFQEQSNSQPNTAIYWANQGNQFWRALKLTAAIEAYDKAIEIDSEFYPPWYGKALVRTFQNQYDAALANYNQAISILEQQIAQFPRETERQEMRDSGVKLRDKIQPRARNPQNTPTPTGNSPTSPTQTESTVQPSPPDPSPAPPTFSPPEPQPEPQPETQPGWLW
jgi:hypothetical protein